MSCVLSCVKESMVSLVVLHTIPGWCVVLRQARGATVTSSVVPPPLMEGTLAAGEAGVAPIAY